MAIKPEAVQEIATRLRHLSADFESERRGNPIGAGIAFRSHIEKLAREVDYFVASHKRADETEEERQRRELGLPSLSVIKGGKQ